MEKKILLEKIDRTKGDFAEAMGITDKEFWDEINRLMAIYNPASLMEKLGLTDSLSVTIASREEWEHAYAQSVYYIWKKKGRKEISLEECIGTYMMLCTVYGKPRQPRLIFNI
jgi:hypothetical protein